MTLEADLRVVRTGFALDVALRAETGAVLAVLGPNGAGKSTVLRALAGLVPEADGRVVVDGRVLADTVAGIWTPPERRGAGVVFQDYLLFPHLSAVDNVAFGLRVRGASRLAARAAAATWLARMGLTEQTGARPRELSGGEAQRVALARALAIEPRLLLLDEPLAALDAATRLTVRADLRRHLDAYGGTTVLVTHDPLDAMVLADRIVVIEAGRIVQEGPPLEVARAPRTDYVARLVGLNLVRGEAHGATVRLEGGFELAVAEPLSGRALVAFAPTAVALFPFRPEGSPRNTWPVVVTGVEQHGSLVRVTLDGSLPAVAEVTPPAVAELRLVPGRELWAALKATETHAYPA